jgi:hypothetical protein
VRPARSDCDRLPCPERRVLLHRSVRSPSGDPHPPLRKRARVM